MTRSATPGWMRRAILAEISYPGGNPPLPGQIVVLALRHRVRYLMLLAGVGYGKTECGAVQHLLCVRDNPGTKHIIVEPTYRMIQAVAIPKLYGLLDRIERRAGRRIGTLVASKGEIHWANGCISLLRGADKPQYLEGLEVTSWWFDESERAYYPMRVLEVLQRRLRQPAEPERGIFPQYYHALVTTTPRDRPGGAVQHWLTQIRYGNPQYRIERAWTTENPYLRPDYVEDLRRSHSDYLFRQQVYAEIIEHTNAIYGQSFSLEYWDPDRPAYSGNMIDWEYKADLPTYVFIDPGAYRAAVLWYQLDSFGTYTGQPDTGVIYHELVKDGLSEADIVQYILTIHRRNRWRMPDGYVIDPNDRQSAIADLLYAAFRGRGA